MTTTVDITAALALVRADGIRHYERAAALLAEAETLGDGVRRRELLLERSSHHTELAKAAALLTSNS
jgi:hypothetical protein